MKRIILLLLIINISVLQNIKAQTTIDTTKAIGSTYFNISTSPSGVLNINIPIPIQGGGELMKPGIALVYNNDTKVGLAGIGWTLSSQSSIMRTGRFQAIDGEIMQARFDSTDRLMLDGNRMLAKTGKYDQANSVYTLRAEQFNLITQTNYIDNVNCSFVSEGKDGTKYYYGNQANSKIANSEGKIFRWLLSEVKDISGNRVKYNYQVTHMWNDAQEVLLRSIVFGITADSNNTSYDSVVFKYENAPKAGRNFYHDVEIVLEKRLLNIINYSNGIQVRKFTCIYDSNSRLTEVKEEGTNGKMFNSLLFEWSEPTPNDSVIHTLPYQNVYRYFGDLNGDNMNDVVVLDKKSTYSTGDVLKIYIKNSTGYQRITDFQLPSNFKSILLNDIDNNGITDIIVKTEQKMKELCDGIILPDKFNSQITDEQTSNPEALIVPDSCYFFYTRFTPYYVNNNSLAMLPSQYGRYYRLEDTTLNAITGDFNADGKQEYIFFTNINGSTKMYKADGIPVKSFPNNLLYADTIFTADYNSDGRTDIILHYKEDFIRKAHNKVLAYDGHDALFHTIDYDAPYLGDMNGDGYIDGLAIDTIAGKTYISIYYYDGIKCNLLNVERIQVPNIAKPNPYTNPYFKYELNVSDYNNDGITDIFLHPQYYDPYATGLTIRDSVTNTLYIGNGGGKFTKVDFKVFLNQIRYKSDYAYEDVNGDGQTDILVENKAYFYAPLSKTNKIVKLTDAFKQQKTIEYALPNKAPQVYTKGTGAVFPLIDIVPSQWVVSRILYPDALGNTVYTKFTYKGARFDLKRDFLIGYKEFTTVDSISTTTNTSYFEYDTIWGEAYNNKNVTLVNGNIILETNNTYSFRILNNPKRYFKVPISQTSSNALTGIINSTTWTIDSVGNTTQITENKGGVATITTNTTYTKPSGLLYACVPSVISVTTKHTDSGASTFTSTKYQTFDSLGRLLSSYKDSLLIEYEYNDTTGLLTKITTIANGTTTQDSIAYDSSGKRVKSKTNALGFVTEYTYTTSGLPYIIKDANNNTLTYYYDDFARNIKTISSLGDTIKTIYKWVGKNPAIGVKLYSVTTQKSGLAPATVYYDAQGKELKVETRGIGNALYTKENSYDKFGRIIKASNFYANTSDRIWMRNSFDIYGRQDTISTDSTAYKYIYNGRRITIKNLKTGQSETTVYDAAGLVDSVYAASGKLNYTYHQTLQVKQINYPGGNTTYTYDNVTGKMATMTDKDKGTETYTYFANGLLKSTKDAKNKTISYTYDALHRVLTRVADSKTTKYYYDTQKKGMIDSVSMPNHKIHYVYDTKGRVSQVNNKIISTQYISSYTYDQYNRPITETYPSTGFAIKYEYDAYSNLRTIKNNSNDSLIWQLDLATNTKLQYSYGNGVINRTTYTPYGYLISQVSGTSTNPTSVQNFTYSFNHANGNLRMRTSGTLSEYFTYDTSDRLFKDSLNSLNYYTTYNTSNNNLSYKTELGSYTYNASKIHQLSSVTNPYGLLPNTQIKLGINGFNKATYISNGPDSLAFLYGVDLERTRTRLYKNGALKLTKIFAGKYEREDIGTTTTRHLHYIYAPTGLAAIWVRSTTGSVSKDTMYYIHTDHLGSITAVTSEFTTTPKKYSYDAWGRRRNATNWSYTGATAPIFARGYTGHEHLDVFGVINMNGRMYDPRLGLFLSADPYVQNPNNPLNYNRYSYVLNNPLKYTDPSGYQYQNDQDKDPTPIMVNPYWLRHSGGYNGYGYNGADTRGNSMQRGALNRADYFDYIDDHGLNVDMDYFDYLSYKEKGFGGNFDTYKTVMHNPEALGGYGYRNVEIKSYAGSGAYMNYKGSSYKAVPIKGGPKGEWLYFEFGGKITLGLQAQFDIFNIEALARPAAVTLVGGSSNNRTGVEGELIGKNGSEVTTEFGIGNGILGVEISQQFNTANPNNYSRTLDFGFLFLGGVEINWNSNGYSNFFAGLKFDPKIGFILGAEGVIKLGFQSK